MKRILSFTAAMLMTCNLAMAQTGSKIACVWGQLDNAGLSDEKKNAQMGEIQKSLDWFNANFADANAEGSSKNGKFVSMSDVINNPDGIMNDVKVLWLNVDIPARSYDDNVAIYNNTAFINAVKTFVKNGGSLLLTKEAVPLVNLIGRMCAPTATGHSDFINVNPKDGDKNTRLWVVRADLGSKTGRGDHPVYVGVTKDYNDNNNNNYYGYAFVKSTSWYTDTNTGWTDLYPKGEGVTAAAGKKGNGEEACLREFEQSWNCIDLGTWGHIGDYFGAFIVEFLPGMFNDEEWKGTVITCGPAAYQWVNQNDYVSNVKTFTKNALNYLLTKPDAAASATFNAAAEIATGKYVSTFCSDKASLIPDGVTAYTSSVSGSTLTLNKVEGNIIPANTGVMLIGNAAEAFDFQLYPVPAESLGDNAFRGTTTEKTGSELKGERSGETLYVLTKKNGKLGFYPLGDATTVGAGKAYLAVNSDTPVRSFDINLDDEGEVTAIAEIEVLRNGENETCYNLQGQRVAQPQKGLYIKNGKKVIIK